MNSRVTGTKNQDKVMEDYVISDGIFHMAFSQSPVLTLSSPTLFTLHFGQ